MFCVIWDFLEILQVIGERTQDGDRDGCGGGNEGTSGNEDESGSGDISGGRNGNRNGEGRRAGRGLGNAPRRERSRVEDQTLPFSTRHDLCRHEAAVVRFPEPPSRWPPVVQVSSDSLAIATSGCCDAPSSDQCLLRTGALLQRSRSLASGR